MFYLQVLQGGGAAVDLQTLRDMDKRRLTKDDDEQPFVYGKLLQEPILGKFNDTVYGFEATGAQKEFTLDTSMAYVINVYVKFNILLIIG